jgi:hypothetical protein
MNKRFARWDVASVIDRFTRYKKKIAEASSAHSLIQSVIYGLLTGYELDLTMGIELIMTGTCAISSHKYQPFYLNVYIALSTNENMPRTLQRKGNTYETLPSNLDVDYRYRPRCESDDDDGSEALENNEEDELEGHDATIFTKMGHYEYTLYERYPFPTTDYPEQLVAIMSKKKDNWWRLNKKHPLYKTHFVKKLPEHFVVSPRGPEFPPYHSLLQHDKNNGVDFDVEDYRELLRYCELDEEFGEQEQENEPIPPIFNQNKTEESGEEEEHIVTDDHKVPKPVLNQEQQNVNDHINNFISVDNPDYMEKQKLKFGLMITAAFFPHYDKQPVIKERLAQMDMTFWDFGKVLVQECYSEEMMIDSEEDTDTENEPRRSYLNEFSKHVIRNIISFSPEPDFPKKFTNKKSMDEAESKLDHAQNSR